MKEFNKNEFLLKTKKNKGKKEVTKKCKWLKKQSQEDKAKICSNTIQFKGEIPIYGQASEVCTETCDSCWREWWMMHAAAFLSDLIKKYSY